MKTLTESIRCALVLTTIMLILPESSEASPLRLNNARVNRDIPVEGRCRLEGPIRRNSERVVEQDSRGRTVRVTYHYTVQAVRCVLSERVAGFPNARIVVDGGVAYRQRGGGSWRFYTFEQAHRYIDGMPPVDRAALNELVQNGDPASVYGFNNLHSITDIRPTTPGTEDPI